MTTQQKFDALNALAHAEVRMRKLGDFYCCVGGIEVNAEGSGILRSEYGNGETPKQAIDECWRVLTELKPNERLVLHAMSDDRKYCRWNGYMWKELPKD